MNIVAILTILVSNMLVYAAPLIFTSIGGAYSEHAGVVNVGLEGIMVMGAFTGVVFNLTFAGSLGGMTIWLSLLAGGLVGLIFSAIHAVATINFRADHVVSGTVLNLLAPALAVFLVKAIYGKGQTNNIDLSFGKFDFPLFSCSSTNISDKNSFIMSQLKFSLNPLLPSEGTFNENVANTVSQVLLGNFAK